MTQEGYESSQKEFNQRMKYEKLTSEFSEFEDIASMGCHLMIYRNKIGTTEPKSMEISGDIKMAAINAMKQEYLKKIGELKKK